MNALVATEGRAPEEVLILPGLNPMIAPTEAEAQRPAREVDFAEAARSRAEIVLNLVRRENATLRQVLAYFAVRDHYGLAWPKSAFGATPENNVG